MNANPNDKTIVEVWFRLRDEMFGDGLKPVAARPPSLREACYAYTLSMRRETETTPEIIEAFVNGLELGAMAALRQAWDATR